MCGVAAKGPPLSYSLLLLFLGYELQRWHCHSGEKKECSPVKLEAAEDRTATLPESPDLIWQPLRRRRSTLKIGDLEGSPTLASRRCIFPFTGSDRVQSSHRPSLRWRVIRLGEVEEDERHVMVTAT